jgi:hypothetical protein
MFVTWTVIHVDAYSGKITSERSWLQSRDSAFGVVARLWDERSGVRGLAGERDIFFPKRLDGLL